MTYHAAYEPKRAVRTRRWKYIRRYGDRTTPVLPNCDDGPSKSLWLDKGWRGHELPVESLYDLVFDPGESNNLTGNPRASQALAEMRTRLESWMQRTDDPLRKGPVPAPRGAKMNNPSGISPKEPID